MSLMNRAILIGTVGTLLLTVSRTVAISPTVLGARCESSTTKTVAPVVVGVNGVFTQSYGMTVACQAAMNLVLVGDGYLYADTDDVWLEHTLMIHRMATALGRELDLSPTGAVGAAMSGRPGFYKECDVMRTSEAFSCLRPFPREWLHRDPHVLMSDTLKAHSMLTGVRPASRPRPFEAIVLLTDGRPAPCDALSRVAATVKADDIVVGAVCLSPRCDIACLKSVVSDADLLVDDPDQQQQLRRLTEPLSAASRRRLAAVSVTITDTASSWISLLPGSSWPPAYVDNNKVVWASLSATGAMPITTTIGARAGPESGRFWTSESALGEFRGPNDFVGIATFPSTWVDVVATHTPSATPTSTLSPMRRIFIPIAVR
jgi:hypothetical protein